MMDNLNKWAQVRRQNSCVLHSSMYDSPPDWVLTGLSDNNITPYVMCCKLNTQDSVPDHTIQDAGTGDRAWDRARSGVVAVIGEFNVLSTRRMSIE